MFSEYIIHGAQRWNIKYYETSKFVKIYYLEHDCLAAQSKYFFVELSIYQSKGDVGNNTS